eukprot:6079050-Amphidinium_carterae.1
MKYWWVRFLLHAQCLSSWPLLLSGYDWLQEEQTKQLRLLRQYMVQNNIEAETMVGALGIPLQPKPCSGRTTIALYPSFQRVLLVLGVALSCPKKLPSIAAQAHKQK